MALQMVLCRTLRQSLPKPKAKQVLVSVRACGVNFPDTLIIQGLYQFKPDLPFTPGSDIAGVVKEVGEEIKHLKTSSSKKNKQ